MDNIEQNTHNTKTTQHCHTMARILERLLSSNLNNQLII